MDSPLCRTASQSQNGCGIMGKHAPQGGVSPMAQKMSVFGINMAKLVLYIAGVARRYPILHLTSKMQIFDRIGHTDVLSPRRMQTPRSGICVGTAAPGKFEAERFAPKAQK